MKSFILGALIFIVSIFIGDTVLTADSKGNINNNNCFSAVNESSLYNVNTSNVSENPYIYVRVLIEGHWWTFIYDLDGSFIVAIPDEDE
jgi:hypothetical protein